MEDGSYIIMKVNGWTDRKLITQKSIADQTEKVISTLKERKELSCINHLLQE